LAALSSGSSFKRRSDEDKFVDVWRILMIIVIPVTDESASRVSEHLGRSPFFVWYSLENDKIVDRGKVPNDSVHFGGSGTPPEKIVKLGANVVVSYGMGAGALLRFKEKNVLVLEAVSPSPIQNIAAYTKGELKELTKSCSMNHRQGVTCR
jgi:predicted Fe-Mo cluster-binding NifX family protein